MHWKRINHFFLFLFRYFIINMSNRECWKLNSIFFIDLVSNKSSITLFINCIVFLQRLKIRWLARDMVAVYETTCGSPYKEKIFFIHFVYVIPALSAMVSTKIKYSPTTSRSTIMFKLITLKYYIFTHNCYVWIYFC